MPELRRDPISDRWVIIATERLQRPSDFQQVEEAEPGSFDPFAEGNEDKTPPEIMAYRERGTQPNTKGWRVRVVPNKFPALQIEGGLQKGFDGIYDRMRGIGAHEVIIETPKTVQSFTSLPDAHVQEIIWTYRDRLLDLRKDRRFKYGMLFKNVGRAAGATLYHTHSQLIVTPIVPRTVNIKLQNAQSYFQFRGRSLYEDMVHQETDQKVRLVMQTEKFVAFVPYAPRFPFETWIFPCGSESRFEDLTPTCVEQFAFLLKRVLLKLEKGLRMPPYNYMLYTLPFDMPNVEYYSWHLEIIPRLTPMAGFEWGTGFYINPVPPEDAAGFLREVKG